MTVFQDIISLDVPEDDLTEHLKLWLPTYLAEVAEQRGLERGVYPKPKFWATTPALTMATLEQVRYPAVLVVSSGAAQAPTRRGDGVYEATYVFGVACLTTGRGEQSSSQNARRYGAAIRTILMQKPGFADYVEGVNWIDERFTDYVNTEQEALSSATEIFNITIKDLGSAAGGPVQPDPDPDPNHDYGDNPTVRDPDSAPPYWPVTSTTPLEGS